MTPKLAALLALPLLLTACPKPDESDDEAGEGESSSGDTTTTTGETDTGESSSSSESGDSESDTSSESGTDTTGETDTTSESETGEPALLPDIDMSLVLGEIEESAYTETLNFSPNDCAVEEACVVEPGMRRLLRFSTYTPNVGTADMIVGSPNLEPEKFEWGACHGHYHFQHYASYRLLDGEGNEVATGHKQAFALIDFAEFSPNAGPGKFPLEDGTQGITMGWQDIYDGHLDCQWVDITGIAPGDYQLEISINYEHVIEELSYDNNVALVPVTITDMDTGSGNAPPEWTCEPAYYGTNDGCDCGCGALDPDCMNPTQEACQYCNNPGSCAQGQMGCAAIADANNAVCK